MSKKIVCKCEIAEVSNNVLNRALNELKARHPQANLKIVGDRIQFVYDSDYQKSAMELKLEIEKCLAKHKKEEAKQKQEEAKQIKIKLFRAIKRSGFKIDGIKRIKNNLLSIRGSR